MTIEEAIKNLKIIKIMLDCSDPREIDKEAVVMAIKSLEAWGKVKEKINSMANIIYRWDAIEIIDKYLSEVEQ